MLTSDPVLSSKSGFERSVFMSEPVLSSKPVVLISKPIAVTSKPGFQKSESALSSKSQSVLKSDSVLSSKRGSISEPIAVTSKPGLQEPVMISKSSLSSKPAISEQFRTSKSGLRKMSSGLKPGSDISEKDEKGVMKKESLSEVENESEVECLLRRRVEEFIRKVNTQWKSENIKTGSLLY
ncbi:unnamed protein product [Arabis nemorensis]|uniref:Uncharacterized protein n=1 Tax=Arabis nemorensis TaxID=586526 RepID=A0A565CPW6_9BRAS|nr:unnamed protein product [Arabis nemorensis]